MNRVPVFVGAVLVGLFLALTGCVQAIERSSAPAPKTLPVTPSPTQLPTVMRTTEPTPTATPMSQPFLDVLGPVEGSTLRSNVVVVHGTTSPGATLSINGEVATVDGNGRFTVEVTLSSGTNEIEVIATDARGTRNSEVITVTLLLPQPLFLLVTEPEDQSLVSDSIVRLSGRTIPGVVVSVNGVSVSVDELGIFSTTVTLEPGPNIIGVVATSVDGQVESAVIAVIYRP